MADTQTATMIGNSQPRRDLIKEIIQCIPPEYLYCFSAQTRTEILNMEAAMKSIKEPKHAKA